ncbi:acylphosphatase-like isoform X1 [Populus alba x Populus x berolinensis]|uniref:Acylphosphatase-like isoform X1 n=1 Tax=Populus alba x Populus x berolinensis TaxID=444605 RepID=A0AAD6QMZ2_9ROSI|nr:acylphosphatase-like isoform X1 [Populus alba x Populus x berolinensis]
MTMAITNHPSPPQSLSTKTVMKDDKKEVGFFVRVMIKGRVQGVFFRNWTVQEMEQRCRRGPPDAMVTGFQVFPSTDDPGTGFQRKATV